MLDSLQFNQLATDAERDGIEKYIVGAIIEQDGNVLLLKRPADDFMGGIWELPSGGVEPGEGLDVALRREVAEETGLEVSDIREYIGSFDYPSSSGKESRQFNFAVDVGATEPIMLQEHDTYQWAPLGNEPPVTPDVSGVLVRYRQY